MFRYTMTRKTKENEVILADIYFVIHTDHQKVVEGIKEAFTNVFDRPVPEGKEIPVIKVEFEKVQHGEFPLYTHYVYDVDGELISYEDKVEYIKLADCPIVIARNYESYATGCIIDKGILYELDELDGRWLFFEKENIR